jgi:hypothetical protein
MPDISDRDSMYSIEHSGMTAVRNISCNILTEVNGIGDIRYRCVWLAVT